jgi:hypothetical protein
MKIKITLLDNDGAEYEGEVFLNKIGKPQKSKNIQSNEKTWYKKGSTVEKIIRLIDEGYFHTPRSISEIIKKLTEKDYHFKAPDLTLPLRNIVRKDLLKKVRDLPDGTKSKVWRYVK